MMYVVAWFANEKYMWFIAYIKDKINANEYVTAHLEKAKPGVN